MAPRLSVEHDHREAVPVRALVRLHRFLFGPLDAA
jgi:hypothetical protein